MDQDKRAMMLMGEYSDFYKDIHGIRPTLPKPYTAYTVEEAHALIQSCHDYLNAVASTSLGRQQLENDGWIVNGRLPSEDGPDDEHDQFHDDVDADADVLRSAGFGTDEDYGYADEVL